MTNPFDFKKTYKKHLATFGRKLSKEQALSMAVGGDFDATGMILSDLTRLCGLQPDHFLIDVGCGPGRLAKHISPYLKGRYLGIDVVPDFLAYAKEITQRPDWQFEAANGLSIPAETGSADMVCFLSVFTHLLHQESYLYLEEAFRVLKPGGCAVVSFLEFEVYSHWVVFRDMVEERRQSAEAGVLNQFMSRDALQSWAIHIGFKIENIWPGDTPYIPLSEPVKFEGGTIYEQYGTGGQSMCLMRKPVA